MKYDRRGHSFTAAKTGAASDRRVRLWLRLPVLCLALTAALVFSMPAAGAGTSPNRPEAAVTAPSPASPKPTLPSDAKPPGEREPLVGFLAAVSIVIAAAAGIYVYRVIRTGL